jgi:hypothetical protein
VVIKTFQKSEIKMKFFLVLLACVAGLAVANPIDEDSKLLDCITNPCITVPGVGKLKGTKKVSF